MVEEEDLTNIEDQEEVVEIVIVEEDIYVVHMMLQLIIHRKQKNQVKINVIQRVEDILIKQRKQEKKRIIL